VATVFLLAPCPISPRSNLSSASRTSMFDSFLIKRPLKIEEGQRTILGKTGGCVNCGVMKESKVCEVSGVIEVTAEGTASERKLV
jgi:hypothetical protein